MTTWYRRRPAAVKAIRYLGPDSESGIDALTAFGVHVEPTLAWDDGDHTLLVWQKSGKYWTDLPVGYWVVLDELTEDDVTAYSPEDFEATFEPAAPVQVKG